MPPRYSPNDEPDKLDGDPIEAAPATPIPPQTVEEDPEQPEVPPGE